MVFVDSRLDALRVLEMLLISIQVRYRSLTPWEETYSTQLCPTYIPLSHSLRVSLE